MHLLELTEPNGKKIFLNFLRVIYIEADGDGTGIYFEHPESLVVTVKEPPGFIVKALKDD